MKRITLGLVIAALLSSVAVLATDGPLTALMNIKVRTNENGYLITYGGAAGVTDGPLTAMANLRGRTNENGYLLITLSGGPISPSSVSIAQGTLTADAQALSSTATWNNAGVTFTHWKANVTDTASNAASLLLDLQKAGVSQFSVNKSGTIAATGSVQVSGELRAGSAQGISWASRTLMASPSDGVMTLSNNASTDFSRLQFGGTTSSFPALKRNAAVLEVRLADDSAAANLNAANGAFAGAMTAQSFGNYATGRIFISQSAPTIASGFGTSPSIVASNGTAAFTINVGTGGTAQTGVLTMPAATTGWRVTCDNTSTNTATVFITKQTAFTTTSATIGSYDAAGAASAWVASNVLVCSAIAF